MRSIGLVVMVMVALGAGCVGEESVGTIEQSIVNPPTGLTATIVSPYQVDLTWDAVPDAEYYVVQHGLPPGPTYDRTSVSPASPSWSDVTAATNRQNAYRVKVAVDGEVSPPSDEIIVTLPAFLPPTNVVATAPQANGIHLSWTAAEYATKYYLFRAVGAGSFSYLTTVVGTSYDDLGLAPSTQYRYQLVSGDDVSTNHQSVPSSTATATTPATTPQIAPPSSVTATAASSSSIRVEWSAVSGATKYYVFQREGAGALAYVGTALGTSWDAIGLAASTEYSFVIQAVDVFDNASSDSAIATATTLAVGTGAAAAPTVSATAFSSSHIQVSWNTVPNAVKYYVFQAQGAGPYAYVATFVSTSYTASNLSANTSYSFKVQAVDVFDIASPDSAPASATTFADGQSGVAAPTGVAATAISSSRIDVTWSSVSGATKYYVFQAQGAGPFVYAGTALSTSFGATGLAASTTYSYVIQAVDGVGVASASSADASATTFAEGSSTVSAPTNVAAMAISSSRIEVTWTPVSGAVKYYVFQAQGAGPLVYATTTLAATYTATDLAASTSYTYVIKAVDSSDAASADSAPASATTESNAPTLPAPTGVNATAVSSSRIDVSWTAVSGAAKYHVYQAQGAGSTSYVATVDAPATSYSATGLMSSTSYSFQVAAVDANDIASSLSAVASATTSAAVHPPTETCDANGWCPLVSPLGTSLRAIWGTDDNDLWVFSSFGGAARWDGTAWTITGTGLTGGFSTTISDVWGSGPNDIWVAAGRWVQHRDEVRVLHWDGSTWTNQLLKSMIDPDNNARLPGLRAVWGSAANNVYAVDGNPSQLTGQGSLYHFNGTQWSTIPNRAGVDIHGSAADNIYIAGSTTHRWNGATWSTVPIPVPTTRVWVNSPTDVWFDTGATAYHYNGTSLVAIPSVLGTPVGSASRMYMVGYQSAATREWPTGFGGSVTSYATSIGAQPGYGWVSPAGRAYVAGHVDIQGTGIIVHAP